MEKPILFSTEMVKAILEGKKTTTRRVVKFKKGFSPTWTGYVLDKIKDLFWLFGSNNEPASKKSPYQVGDTIWVRETWHESECFDFAVKGGYAYLANEFEYELSQEYQIKWRPSIHMPRKAARLFLKVTNVRCERLQDITEDGAKAEGIKSYTKDGNVFKYCVSDDLWFSQKGTWQDMPRSAKQAFEKLWDSIYNNWNSNPWVWVIEFERMV